MSPNEGAISMRLAERVAVNAAAQLIGQLLLAAGGLVAVAVTARYLGVRDYGALVTALIYISLFVIATDFGLATIGARELAKREDEGQTILSSLGWLVMVISVAAAAVAAGLSFVIYPGPLNEKTRMAIFILLPQFLVAAPRAVAQSHLIVRQKLYLSALAGVVTRMVTLGLVFAVAAANLGFLWMTATYTAFPLFSTVLMFTLARPPVRLWRSWDRSVGLSIFRAALPLAGVVFLNYLYFRLDLFLLSLLATPVDVARYGVAYKVIETLILLPSFVMATLLPDVARTAPFSDRLNGLVQNAFSAMQLLALPVVALSFFSGEILRFIAGAEYTPAALTLQLLMVGVAISFLQQVFGFTLVAQNRQLYSLYVLGGVLLLNLTLNLILIPLFAIEGAAVALVISEVASLVGIAAAYSRVGRLPRPYLPLRTATAAAAMAAIILAVRSTLPEVVQSPFVTLAVGGTLGGVVYVLTLWQLHAVPPAVNAVASGLLRRHSLTASHS
jgi:O-antigen/teichoic acid export membrane protein